MDAMKLFTKIKKEFEILINKSKNFIDDIGIEFKIIKCATSVRFKERCVMTCGADKQNNKVRELTVKDDYKYFGVIKDD